jgi:hypothetical protein
MSVLERIAEYVAGADPGALSAEQTEALAIHVLDAVGAMIAGRATPEGAARHGRRVEKITAIERRYAKKPEEGK